MKKKLSFFIIQYSQWRCFRFIGQFHIWKYRGLEGGGVTKNLKYFYLVKPHFRGINKRVRTAQIKSLLLKPIQNGGQFKLLTSRLLLTGFHCWMAWLHTCKLHHCLSFKMSFEKLCPSKRSSGLKPIYSIAQINWNIR